MNDNVQMYLDDAEEKMQSAVSHYESELAKVRAGRANPMMLAGIMVDNYGTPSPINQVANVGTTDARTIVVQPWDKANLGKIEKEIQKANLGFNPINDGQVLRIVVPPLTEERRKNLVKQVKQDSENAKVAVRNIRKDTNNGIKSMEKKEITEDESKQGQEAVQKLTDKYVAEIEKISAAKEAEIMKV